VENPDNLLSLSGHEGTPNYILLLLGYGEKHKLLSGATKIKKISELSYSDTKK
jgi:hypothetical protein